MKKHIAVVLALVLAFSICLMPMAAAAEISLSSQNLTVDGKAVNCEKYNIDGSNYFKLRDIAYLLSGTSKQFSVNWDEAAQAISIVTGEAYTANGTELDLSGGDKSATAAPSSQTIKINGTAAENLSVYNIGGNNYFKLRDLADAMGFEVGYEAETATATIKTKEEMQWLQTKMTVTQTSGEISTTTETAWTYNDARQLLTETVTNADGTTQSYSYIYGTSGNKYSGTLTKADGTTAAISYTYSPTGKLLSETVGDTVKSYNYDANGNLVTLTATAPGSITISTFAYDAAGNVTEEVYASTNGTGYRSTATYDEVGRLISDSKTAADGSTTKSTYAYNAKGDLMTQTSTLSDGTITMTTHVYGEDGNVTASTLASSDGSNANTTYEYAENGNLSTVTTTASNGSKTVTTYEWKEFVVKA